MESEQGIWRKALDICMRNSGSVALYVGLMVVISVAQDYMKGNSGLFFAQALAAAMLAIPAHLSVLRNINGSEGMKLVQNNKLLMPFALRGFGLGLLALVLPFIVMIVVLLNGNFGEDGNLGLAIIVAGFLATILSALVFAKWGTMLPAVVIDADKRFATAGLRGKKIFGYAFPRLLISFGLLTVVILVVAIAAGQFSPGNGQFFPHGKIDFVVIAASLLSNLIGAYQIAMTAVILSRAFMRAESTTAA